MQWHNNPDINDMINILQEQGYCSFNPTNLKENNTINRHTLKKSKSAQKFIDENKKRIELEKYNEENKLYNNIISNNNIFTLTKINTILKNFSLDYFKYKYLFHLFYLKISNEIKYHIYYSIKISNIPIELNEEKIKLESIFEEKLNSNKIIKLQMTKLSSYLYPLNVFNFEKMKLDDWQVDIFKKIEDKKNILLVAKTSAGKTVCSTYTVTLYSKILFILPSDELARQVAGIIRNLIESGVALITNKDKFFENDNFKVLVGTPLILEDYLIKNKIFNFDYIICDEIHQIRDFTKEGASYERILKILNGKMLIMSATISNVNEIKTWLEYIKGEPFDLIEHDKRFINQQKYIWKEDKLESLHPLTNITIDDIKSNKLHNIFTSNDLYNLYEKSLIHLPNELSSKYDPNIFFQNKLILKLEDIKDFENHIKLQLLEMSNNYAEQLTCLLDSYKLEIKPYKQNILKLILHLKEKNLYPVIFFKQDSTSTVNIYNDLLDTIESEENKLYPNYRDNLRIQQKFYESMMVEINKTENITKFPAGYNNFYDYINDVKKNIKEKYLREMKEKFKSIYNSKINKISNEEEKNILMNEFKLLNELDEILSIDIDKPHPDFSFASNMNSEKMRKIKRRVSKTLNENISYEDKFLQGIERGIIAYHSCLNSAYQRELQSVISQKDINFIISDDSLAYGINIPIRSVILLGNDNNLVKWDSIQATQMEGRSGRRGLDREGNIIYSNVILDNTKIHDVNGCDKISVIHGINSNLSQKLLNTTLNEWILKENINLEDRINTINLKIQQTDNSELIWICRFLGEKGLTINLLLEEFDNNCDTIILCINKIHNYLYDREDKDFINSIIENRLINKESLDTNKFKIIGNTIISIFDFTRNIKVRKLLIQLFKIIKGLLEKI